MIGMKDTDLMQFGAHKGKMLKDVPPDYLAWVASQPDMAGKHPGLVAYVKRGSSSSPLPAPRQLQGAGETTEFYTVNGRWYTRATSSSRMEMHETMRSRGFKKVTVELQGGKKGYVYSY